MALTISQFATGSTTTAVTSIDIGSLTAAVGDMLIVAVASDNSATGGASPISSVTDSASNTYTSQINVNRDPGLANEGVSLRVFTSVLATGLSGGTVTVNFSTSTSNANILIWRVQPIAGQIISAGSGGGGVTGLATSASVATTGITLAAGSYTFGFAATEQGGAFTAVASTSSRTWSSGYSVATATETPLLSQFSPNPQGVSLGFTPSWANTADYAAGRLIVTLQETARLYLPSASATPPISPSPDAGWEKTSDLTRLLSSKDKASTTMTTVTATKDVSSTAYDIARLQYLYGPLAAQIIDGSVIGVIRASQNNAAADATNQIVIRIVSGDGATVRGTLLELSEQSLTSELGTSVLYPRYLPVRDAAALAEPAILTSVTTQAGDYLAIEIGVRGREASATSRTFSWRIGDTTATDLDVNELAQTTDNTPNIRFFGPTLSLLTTVTPGTASLSLTAYAPTVSTGGGSTDTSVTPGVASLSTTRYAPTATATANQTVTPTAASLTVTLQTPTATATANVTVTPAAASLSATPYAPEATATANVATEPQAAALALTAFAPDASATANVAVEPAAATLTATLDVPTVSATANQTTTPGEAALTLTTFAPTASVTANQSVTPGAASAALTAFSPDVASTANLSLEAGTLSAALTAHSPAVSTSDAKVSAPATAALALSADAPSVTATANVVVTPAAATLAATRHAPTTAATANRTATPATATIATTTTKPSLALTIDVATASLTATPEAPTRIDGTRRTPASRPLSLTAHAPAVSYTANAVITPQAAALAFVALAPLVINAAPIPATATSRLSATGSATQTLTAPEASLTLVPTAEASLTLSTGGPL